MDKRLILITMLTCASAPALAQPAPGPVGPQLIDPSTGARIGRSMQVLSHALLNLHVGEMQAALEGREPTRSDRNLTVRDLGRRNDPDFDRKFDERIANAGPVIDRSIGAMNQALPELQRSFEQARDAIARATANLPDPTYPRR
ncbi:MAG: hypothetical protein ABIW33_01455 [Sphingomicrobium sp.]